ncbi:MAG: hypothetical protein NVSMB9_12710 [Isosphaeraceae bacterium]
MRWGRRQWSERTARPKVRALSVDEKANLLEEMTTEIAASPVLAGLGLRVRSQRGRFYLERPLDDGDDAKVVEWGRITPLADSDDLLLEHERSKGRWSEIDRGPARKLIETVASDTRGTFHALGALDKGLRAARKGLARLPVKKEGTTRFFHVESGEECTAQEALFHEFGLPLHVLVEPSRWYSYHRHPTIVELSDDRSRVLVRFSASSWSGESFGGTCLYACRDGHWAAYAVKPSESRDIATASAWLVKRKWRPWT